jgi:hypothetical protein
MSSLKEREEAVWASKGKQVLDEYWNWPQGNTRSKWLAETLKQFKFQSIYEVGVFGGRNLHHIHQAFPDVALGGLDINALGIQHTQARLTGQFDVCSAFDLDQVAGSWDIVFTVGVAIHLAPDLFDQFVSKAAKKANSYVIHLEQAGNGSVLNGPKELNPKAKVTNKIRWAPDFATSYGRLGLQPTITTLPSHIRTGDCTNLVVVDVRNKSV